MPLKTVALSRARLMPRSTQTQTVPLKKYTTFLVLSVFLILYILPLGVRDLMVPDETRYAEIPREMIADGDWVVPHLDGVKYFEKPVMGYWIHAIAMLIVGQNNFAVRLPSGASVGLSALLIFLLAGWAERRKEETAGAVPALAALVFLTCFEVFGVGNTAVLDNLFAFFLTATVAAFFLASEASPGTIREKGYLVLAGVACGCAFLTKGFLAIALPVLVLTAYLLWQRRYKDLWRMSWLPLLTAALVALPWSVAIHLREPDFWHFFFWNEHVRRFLADTAQHREPFWFFFIAAPGMFMPWTFLIPAAVAGSGGPLADGGRQGRLMRLSVCWLVLYFLFFSISKGKLLTYILPCFPPFAIIMAMGLSRALHKKRQTLLQWGIAAGGGFFALILLALAYVQIFGYQGFRPFVRPWKALMAINGIFFVVLFCVSALKRRPDVKKMFVYGLSPLFLFFSANFIIPDQTIAAKFPGRLLEGFRQTITPDTVIVSDEETVRAVCWYFRCSNVRVLGNTGELYYGLERKDSPDLLLALDAMPRLIAHHRGKVILVVRSKNIDKWKNRLPPPTFKKNSGPDGYTLWRY
jgi:4-amino-4-deoxy-L-arabinose transferase